MSVGGARYRLSMRLPSADTMSDKKMSSCLFLHRWRLRSSSESDVALVKIVESRSSPSLGCFIVG